jgi:phosphohistidine phosphatase
MCDDVGVITLLLIRHGIAEDPRHGLRDADRALTAQGWDRTRAAMRGLVLRGYRPTRGVASPYRRAAETLVCLKEATAEGFPVACWEGLEPGGDCRAAEDWLRALVAEADPFDTVAVVSHEPFLSALVQHLTGRLVEMKKASCAVVHWTGGRFELAAHFSPAQLRGEA